MTLADERNDLFECWAQCKRINSHFYGLHFTWFEGLERQMLLAFLLRSVLYSSIPISWWRLVHLFAKALSISRFNKQCVSSWLRAQLFGGIWDGNFLCGEYLTAMTSFVTLQLWILWIYKISPVKCRFWPVKLSKFQFPKCYLPLWHQVGEGIWGIHKTSNKNF